MPTPARETRPKRCGVGPLVSTASASRCDACAPSTLFHTGSDHCSRKRPREVQALVVAALRVRLSDSGTGTSARRSSTTSIGQRRRRDIRSRHVVGDAMPAAVFERVDDAEPDVARPPSRRCVPRGRTAAAARTSDTSRRTSDVRIGHSAAPATSAAAPSIARRPCRVRRDRAALADDAHAREAADRRAFRAPVFRATRSERRDAFSRTATATRASHIARRSGATPNQRSNASAALLDEHRQPVRRAMRPRARSSRTHGVSPGRYTRSITTARAGCSAEIDGKRVVSETDRVALTTTSCSGDDADVIDWLRHGPKSLAQQLALAPAFGSTRARGSPVHDSTAARTAAAAPPAPITPIVSRAAARRSAPSPPQSNPPTSVLSPMQAAVVVDPERVHRPDALRRAE